MLDAGWPTPAGMDSMTAVMGSVAECVRENDARAG